MYQVRILPCSPRSWWCTPKDILSLVILRCHLGLIRVKSRTESLSFVIFNTTATLPSPNASSVNVVSKDKDFGWKGYGFTWTLGIGGLVSRKLFGLNDQKAETWFPGAKWRRKWQQQFAWFRVEVLNNTATWGLFEVVCFVLVWFCLCVCFCFSNQHWLQQILVPFWLQISLSKFSFIKLSRQKQACRISSTISVPCPHSWLSDPLPWLIWIRLYLKSSW